MTGLAGKRGAGQMSGPRSQRSRVRHLGALVLVAVAYYAGARIGLTLSLVERNVTPLWPPTGIAVAAFLVFGRSLWPGVAIACSSDGLRDPAPGRGRSIRNFGMVSSSRTCQDEHRCRSLGRP